jgi:histidine triad (HIT) family protein
MTDDCIFCRIIAGEIPSATVYEDDSTLAFLDINPVSKGHVLVIPKTHCDRIYQAPPDVLANVIASVRRVARAQVDGLGAAGLSVSQANGEVAGQIVPHLHFHLIPRYEADLSDRNWHPGAYEDQAEMEHFATVIRKAIDA